MLLSTKGFELTGEIPKAAFTAKVTAKAMQNNAPINSSSRLMKIIDTPLFQINTLML